MKNENLEKVISETENRCARALSDEELGFVNAAGELTVNPGTIGGNTVKDGKQQGEFLLPEKWQS